MVAKFSEAETLVDLFKYVAKKYKSDNCLNYLNRDQWRPFSTKDFVKKTLSVAHYLRSLGINHNTKVAIFAKSSPYWLIYDFAIQLNGGVSVPMFTNISEENLKFQIEQTGVKYAFVDGSDNWQVIKKFMDNFDKVIVHSIMVKNPKIITLSKVFDESNNNNLSISSFKKIIKPENLATIIYTSGSTGVPKGVCLTHKNLISQVKATSKLFHLSNQDIALSFLPLAHIFERMVMLLYLQKNVKVYFADDISNVQNLLAEIKPTIVTTVPRLLEKIFINLKEKINTASFPRQILANLAINYALKTNTKTTKKSPIWKLFNKILYNKIINILGGNIKIMISGGAPLSKNINKFFLNIGLPLYQGYGLTETSPVISVNHPNASKFGSSGKIIPNIEVKIAEDNEILVKGPNVMHGYYKNQKETNLIIENSWLKTGDLGYIDDEGFLFINGRKKELMKTSNGKYVSPINIEEKIKEIDNVETAMIIADGCKFVSAIIFVDVKKLKKNKIKFKIFEQNLNSAIDEINKNLNHWEKIQKFIIAKELPSIENNQLTPSMKIRRHVILANYKKQISSLYK